MTRVTNAPRRLAGWVLDREVGERTEGVLWVVVAVCASFIVTALWYTATANIDPSTSSNWVMRIVLQAATSTWAVPVLIILAFRSVYWGRSDRAAAQAAAVTGMSQRTVQRLAYETRSAVGATRILVAREHSPAEIEDEIALKLDGAGDDRLASPVDADHADGGEDGGGDEDAPLPDRVTNAEENDSDRDTDSDADRPGVARRVALAARSIPGRTAKIVGSLPGRVIAGIRRSRIGSQSQNPHPQRGENTPADPGGNTGRGELTNKPSERVTIRDALALWRRDTAAAFNTTDAITKFAAPAIVVAFAALLPFGFWVDPLFGAAAIALGVLVGAANVLRVRRKRRGRVHALRRDVGTPGSRVVALLVKKVETGDVTAYVAWVGSRQYASYDRDEFIEEVAQRAVETCEGGDVTPSLLEKNAEQLRDYYPHLGTRTADGTANGFLDVEQEQITNELIEQSASGTPAIVPAAKLVEDVVEHDLNDTMFFGLISADGKGYDPRLVKRMLGEAVPGVLVVKRVTVPADGEDIEVPVVRPRWVSMPKRTSETVARFNALYQNVARRDCAYGDPLEFVEQPRELSIPRPTVDAAELDDDVPAAYGVES